MSSKAKGKKLSPADIAYEDRWKSGRARFGLQRFRYGRDKRWHFAGQQPDETVIKVVRQHKVFLVISALPLIGAVGLCILILGISIRLPSFPQESLFDLLAVIFVIGIGLWFSWKNLLEWYLTTYIITDKRLIDSKGVLQPTRQSTPLENVKQVGMDLDDVLGFLLRFGTVHVYLTGGDLIMLRVPDPEKVKQKIDETIEAFKNKKPKEVKPPTPGNPDIAAVIDTLAKGKEIPRLEDADKEYNARYPNKRLGPRRTFGILHLPVDVHYLSGEYTVMYVQRSLYVLARQLAIPVLILLVVLPLAIYVPTTSTPMVSSNLGVWWVIMGLVVLALLVSIALIYNNYVDDVFILTSRRVIDIDRLFAFFFEMSVEIDYKNIRDIKVVVPNVLQRLLDVGNVIIEMAGGPGIVMHTVDHPFFIQDKIVEIQKLKEKAEKVKKENDEKKELHMWFGKVMTTLVETTQVKGAPNLEKMEWLDAMERASEFGFQVVVCGEDPTRPEIPPGYIVRQSPPPGTVIETGGEIQVVLSRKPTSADLLEFY